FESLRRSQGLYREVRKRVGVHAGRFSGNWNCLDGEQYQSLEDPDIKLIHFTRVETQPGLKWSLPHLHAQGKKHWAEFSGRKIGLPHPHNGVAPMVDALWTETQAAGYSAAQFMLPHPFGAYNAIRGSARAA